MRLLKGKKKTALINNARDLATAAERPETLAEEIARLESIGLEPVEVDLRKYFGKPDELKDILAGFDLIWVRGGNVFVLARVFRASGADEIIKELLEKDAVVYGGYSAGIDMLTTTLHGAELVDDAYAVPEGYDPEIIWDAMGILPYSIAPHYKSDHPESPAVDKMVEYLENNCMPFTALRDGEAIVVDGDKTRIVG